MKADDKVKYEGSEKEEKFTNFEELKAMVETLIESVDELAKILSENDLYRTERIEAEGFDLDDVYDKLD